jgi:hypothetical protein
MNSSVYSIDRATHVRVVVAALVASIGLTLFALAARIDGDGNHPSIARLRPAPNIELSGTTQSAPRAHRI